MENKNILSPRSSLNEAIIKVTNECNLACTYCYMYEGEDNDGSWRLQPKNMTKKTVDAIARVLHRDFYSEHLLEDPRREFQIDLHGGEPLLQSPEFIRYAVPSWTEPIINASEGITVPRITMQTNGVLLNRDHLDVLSDHNVQVGVSLDGSFEANRHRINKGGRSTFDQVMKGVELLNNSYDHIFAGILAVIDIENDPSETVDLFASMGARRIDFILPHGNYRNPPPGMKTKEQRMKAPYGEWMVEAFRAQEKYRHWQRLRMADSILSLMAGKGSELESMGLLKRIGSVVIQTNGAYELNDYLKTTNPDQVANTGKNIFEHSFSEIEEYVNEKAGRLGAMALPHACEPCRLKSVCGGGNFAHRYSSEGLTLQEKFDNPTIYHYDYIKMISYFWGVLHGRGMEDIARADTEKSKEEIIISSYSDAFR